MGWKTEEPWFDPSRDNRLFCFPKLSEKTGTHSVSLLMETRNSNPEAKAAGAWGWSLTSN